jgi:hypothetical protein
MVHKLYYKTVAIIFGIIMIIHMARITGQWEAVIGSWTVPMWVSWAAVIIAGYLAVRGFQIADEGK